MPTTAAGAAFLLRVFVEGVGLDISLEQLLAVAVLCSR